MMPGLVHEAPALADRPHGVLERHAPGRDERRPLTETVARDGRGLVPALEQDRQRRGAGGEQGGLRVHGLPQLVLGPVERERGQIELDRFGRALVHLPRAR
jgi:hypothetical protein